MNVIQPFIVDSNKIINDFLVPVTKNQAFLIVLKFIIVLYAALVAPKITSMSAPFITNPAFKVFILSLIVWVYSKDPTLSVLVGMGYFMSLTYLTANSTQEMIQSGVMTPAIAQALVTSPPTTLKSTPGQIDSRFSFEAAV